MISSSYERFVTKKCGKPRLVTRITLLIVLIGHTTKDERQKQLSFSRSYLTRSMIKVLNLGEVFYFY